MRRHLPIAVLCLLAAAAAAATGQPPAPPAPDVALLAQWLTGEFDNFQQYYEAKDTKAPVLYDRVHTVITPLSAPALGATVLLARESAVNAPDRVARLHVYSLAAGPAATIEMRLYVFDEPDALVAALTGPGAPVALPLDHVKAVPGCEVTWRRDGMAFAGTMKPGACQIAWPPAGARGTRETTYRVTADELWFSERATDAAATAAVGGRGDGLPFTLKRARQFNCYAAVRKEGTTDQYDSMLNVIVHDQGKWVTITDAAGKPTKYAFELSQLRYSQQTPVMKLALYEAGQEQAFAYAWADPASWRVGINLRWIQVGCKPA